VESSLLRQVRPNLFDEGSDSLDRSSQLRRVNTQRLGPVSHFVFLGDVDTHTPSLLGSYDHRQFHGPILRMHDRDSSDPGFPDDHVDATAKKDIIRLYKILETCTDNY